MPEESGITVGLSTSLLGKIDKLAEKLGVGVKQLYPIYKKRAALEGALLTILGVVLIGLSAILLLEGFEWEIKVDIYEGRLGFNTIEDIDDQMAKIFLWVLGVGGLTAAGTCLYHGVLAWGTSSYVAVERLARTLSRFTD